MSVFLLYFEQKNPAASWKAFQQQPESVVETFNDANTVGSLLNMEGAAVIIDGKRTPVFIIHDGVSSDRIFTNGPLAAMQQTVVVNFFKRRLLYNAFEHFFIFHLYHQAIDAAEIILYEETISIQLAAIADGSFIGRQDCLYKLIK
jgi:hypothetical protein